MYGLKPVPFMLKPVPFMLKPVPFMLKPVPFMLKPVAFPLKPIQFRPAVPTAEVSHPFRGEAAEWMGHAAFLASLDSGVPGVAGFGGG